MMGVAKEKSEHRTLWAGTFLVFSFTTIVTICVQSSLCLNERSRPNWVSPKNGFSKELFSCWKIPISISRVVQSGGKGQIKGYCFRSGPGFWHWQLDNYSFGLKELGLWAL